MKHDSQISFFYEEKVKTRSEQKMIITKHKNKCTIVLENVEEQKILEECTRFLDSNDSEAIAITIDNLNITETRVENFIQQLYEQLKS